MRILIGIALSFCIFSVQGQIEKRDIHIAVGGKVGRGDIHFSQIIANDIKADNG